HRVDAIGREPQVIAKAARAVVGSDKDVRDPHVVRRAGEGAADGVGLVRERRTIHGRRQGELRLAVDGGDLVPIGCGRALRGGAERDEIAGLDPVRYPLRCPRLYGHDGRVRGRDVDGADRVARVEKGRGVGTLVVLENVAVRGYDLLRVDPTEREQLDQEDGAAEIDGRKLPPTEADVG